MMNLYKILIFCYNLAFLPLGWCGAICCKYLPQELSGRQIIQDNYRMNICLLWRNVAIV